MYSNLSNIAVNIAFLAQHHGTVKAQFTIDLLRTSPRHKTETMVEDIHNGLSFMHGQAVFVCIAPTQPSNGKLHQPITQKYMQELYGSLC